MARKKKHKRCVIITAYCRNSLRSCIDFFDDDTIICADAGYKLALAEEIRPDIIIGDFDSAEKPDIPDCKIIGLPEMKDDTDTLSCLRYALSLGAPIIIILGGIGARLDHTYANLQTLVLGSEAGRECILTDGDNIVTTIADGGRAVIPYRKGYTLSVFAYSNECENVCLSGTLYPLVGARLGSSFPIGVSNRITASHARISLSRGRLIIIQSKID